jgi:putative transposase
MTDPSKYRWRQITPEQRINLLAERRQRQHPEHSPHHIDSGKRNYHITAACFEHAPHIGQSTERMSSFAEALLDTLTEHSASVAAWVLLPNHYHALLHTNAVLPLLHSLGQLHGRSSFQWNGEEQTRGRQVWCKAIETTIKSDGHYHATVNYIHHNPVKHGYIAKWSEWPWSSATEYLQTLGREEALRRWQSYPIDRYGEGWDDAHL